VSDYQFEEEEFTTEFNGKTLLRILGTTRSHWKWVVGFLLAVAFISALDSYLTYLSKRIIDEGILASDKEALLALVIQYGILIIFEAAGVFAFIYLSGILGERVQYDLRQ
jgi:ATP-binding cassette subfamily B protein